MLRRTQDSKFPAGISHVAGDAARVAVSMSTMDVLVPDGAIDAMAQAMTAAGAVGSSSVSILPVKVLLSRHAKHLNHSFIWMTLGILLSCSMQRCNSALHVYALCIVSPGHLCKPTV